jgi:hypothetical protein
MKSLRNGTNDGLWVPAKALLGTPGSLAFEWMQRRWRAEATGGIFACSQKAKWKSRFTADSSTPLGTGLDDLRAMVCPHTPRSGPRTDA